MKQPIFIHIPKTGGTTLNCVIKGSDWQTTPDYHYRHIELATRLSNSGDIFRKKNWNQYKDEQIFMMVRNPVDRLISEYYFIKDRQEFIGHIKPVPKTFEEYIQNRQTANYMLKFLLGFKMYDTRQAKEFDLDLVVQSIQELDITVGVFEEYSDSINLVSDRLGLQFPKTIEKKRVTLNRPDIDEISEKTKELISSKNALDVALYEYCQKRFTLHKSDLKSTQQHHFQGGKYEYILKYTQRFPLINITSNNQAFYDINRSFFDDLNKYLQLEVKLDSGYYYTLNWNNFVIKALKQHLEDALKEKPILTEIESIEDPLTKSKQLSLNLNQIIGKNDQLLPFSPFSVKLQKPGFVENLRKKWFKS